MTASVLDNHEVRSMTYAGLPGLSIGVVHDQDPVWARGFGWVSLERKAPATAETLYRIASITKLFTATRSCSSGTPASSSSMTR